MTKGSGFKIQKLTPTRITAAVCAGALPLIAYFILRARLYSKVQQDSGECGKNNNKIRYTPDGKERKRVDIWDTEAWKKNVKVKPVD